VPAEPLPDHGGWHRPPEGGYTADDLDRIPDLPPHTELIDGTLVLMSPQKSFHTVAIDVLVNGLRACIPVAGHIVRREMSVVLGQRQRPEPDVLVVRAEAEPNLDQAWFPADAVVLAVEVVSPDSEVRDRQRKPQLYAEAGIPHFWRVENEGGAMVLYAFELDPATRQYGLPFAIDIDLTEIGRI
jgi:Uma2 family endonuclease